MAPNTPKPPPQKNKNSNTPLFWAPPFPWSVALAGNKIPKTGDAAHLSQQSGQKICFVK